VLSAGQTIQTDGKSASISTPVVTLLVNPVDAEILTLANNEGHIQLVLRNSSDDKITVARGRQTLELFGGGAEPPPLAATPSPAPAVAAKPRRGPAPVPIVRPSAQVLVVASEPNQITVIRGTAKTVETGISRDGVAK